MTGYLPERVPFYGEFTIKGYLGFVADVKGLKGREKDVNDNLINIPVAPPMPVSPNVSYVLRRRQGGHFESWKSNI